LWPCTNASHVESLWTISVFETTIGWQEEDEWAPCRAVTVRNNYEFGHSRVGLHFSEKHVVVPRGLWIRRIRY
jgi:hypothetical protein